MRLKEPRFRSRAYLMHVCSLPCVACGINPGGVAHHLMRGSGHGVGLKAPDDMTISLCHPCHNALHMDGDEVGWLAMYGIDGPAEAKRIHEIWLGEET